MELQFGKSSNQWIFPAMSAQELPSQHKDLRASRPAESQWTAEEEERQTSRRHLGNVDLGPLEMVEDLLTVYEAFHTMGVP